MDSSNKWEWKNPLGVNGFKTSLRLQHFCMFTIKVLNNDIIITWHVSLKRFHRFWYWHQSVVSSQHCLFLNFYPGSVNSAAAKQYFFKWVQPAVRHRLTYIKIFVLTSSLRKPMLISWHFGAGGDILGQKHVFFFTKKCEKLELYYKTVKIHQRVVMSRGSNRNVSYNVML